MTWPGIYERNRNFSGGRGVCFGFPDSSRMASIEAPNSSTRSPCCDSSQAQVGGSSTLSYPSMSGKHIAATDSTSRRKRQARNEMIRSTPTAQICTAFGDQPQYQKEINAVYLRELHADQLIEQGADIEVKRIGLPGLWQGLSNGSDGRTFYCESLMSTCAIC